MCTSAQVWNVSLQAIILDLPSMELSTKTQTLKEAWDQDRALANTGIWVRTQFWPG